MILQRLGDDPRLGRKRVVLCLVLAGESVGAAARQLGISREHLSNTAWRTVSAWVLDAFEQLGAAPSTPEAAAARRGRVSVLD